MVTEPIITCPGCQREIKLTESLAAPLVESMRRDYEKRLAQKDADAALHEKKLAGRELAIQKAKDSLDEQVAEKLKGERAKIVSDEARKARLLLAAEFDQKITQIAELQDVLKQREEKLAEAQKAQADLIRKERELDDAKREMDLTVEKRVQSSLASVREQAKKDAEEHLSLKVLEREQTIISMQKQIEELKRKAEQGSQQLQGEVLELQLETLLGNKFPLDQIHPVPKGEHGGDLIHRVMLPTGVSCGTILWETKRTKNWSDGWLAKLRDDQRAARAEVAVIVSAVLPKGVDTFDQVGGVWIAHPRCALPVALSLRQMLIDVGCARHASEGQQTKMEMIYQYLTGPNFRLRVQAIVEAFTCMGKELAAERKAITAQWAKRQIQIDRVMEATVGMYGDLHGIAGKTIQEIDGLEIKMLGDEVTAAH